MQFITFLGTYWYLCQHVQSTYSILPIFLEMHNSNIARVYGMKTDLVLLSNAVWSIQ